MAIVIDDLGNDPQALARIARWPFPVAGAVLPALPGSESAARDLARAGKEVLLHLPMEPLGAARPGPGVISVGQSEEEIARTLESDLRTVPGAAGVNNHMGSAATSDPRVMRAVLARLRSHDLFFLDSRTTDSTVARRLAEEMRVPALSRRVFLDADPREPAVRAALAELVRHAREEGSAVGIGHPYATTLAVLEEDLPRLAGQGVRLARVGEIVEAGP